jgi:hypothetical protein
MKKKRIGWLEKPAAGDIAAARNYLSLLYPDRAAGALAAQLRRVGTRKHKAVDLFRAAGLPVAEDNLKEDRRKIRAGKKLGPILLVRDPQHRRVVIADGYHRLSAAFEADEEARVACRIAGP